MNNNSTYQDKMPPLGSYDFIIRAMNTINESRTAGEFEKKRESILNMINNCHPLFAIQRVALRHKLEDMRFQQPEFDRLMDDDIHD